MRLLSGGYAIKRSKLNQFRAENATLFASAIDQTVAMAKAEGLLAVDEMALDSMRLRAHASNAQVRMLSRSTSRLEELRAVDPSTLTDEERARHKAKVEKHTKAIADCQRLGVARAW